MACKFPRADDWVETSRLNDRAGHTPEGIRVASESKERHKGIDGEFGKHSVCWPSSEDVEQLRCSDRTFLELLYLRQILRNCMNVKRLSRCFCMI